MNRATPQMRKIAVHLLHYEIPKNEPPGTNNPTAYYFIDKLRPHLATLMGSAGFRALVLRALMLAKGEVYWLRSVQVNADGTLERLEGCYGQLDATKYLEGKVVLMAHMLGLLVALIGPTLTARLIGDIWPKSALNGSDFGNGGKNDKAK